MSKLIAAAVVGLFGLTAGPAAAADAHYGYKKVVVEEYVTVYLTKAVPYTKEVTKYDACGKPYTVCVTCYRDVQVPVRKCVTVTKWVKVCG